MKVIIRASCLSDPTWLSVIWMGWVFTTSRSTSCGPINHDVLTRIQQIWLMEHICSSFTFSSWLPAKVHTSRSLLVRSPCSEYLHALYLMCSAFQKLCVRGFPCFTCLQQHLLFFSEVQADWASWLVSLVTVAGPAWVALTAVDPSDRRKTQAELCQNSQHYVRPPSLSPPESYPACSLVEQQVRDSFPLRLKPAYRRTQSTLSSWNHIYVLICNNKCVLSASKM